MLLGGMVVDLNIDIGEGDECDVVLLALASSANIACGGHAGGGERMCEALARARHEGVAIGAHPGYRDRENFGRVETGDAPRVIAEEMRRQMMDFCEAYGQTPHHVKPHGALYHRADHDADVARVICEVIQEVAPGAWVYAFAGGGMAAAAVDAGLAVCGEGFIDRAYAADGMLVPRGVPGAVIESPDVAAAQAMRLAVDPRIGTLCVHGDGPHADKMLKAARMALVEAGCVIGPPNLFGQYHG